MKKPVIGQTRPLQVVHGALTETPEDMLAVTLEAGLFYDVDEDGVVRDAAGEIVCALAIWRLLPRRYPQQEAVRALAVISELAARVPDDENHYPGWLRNEVTLATEELKAIIGDYQP
jgi:hypothetical protein